MYAHTSTNLNGKKQKEIHASTKIHTWTYQKAGTQQHTSTQKHNNTEIYITI